MTFVEVQRVRRFRFTPRHCQSDSDLELDLREMGKRQIFSQICRDHPACGCAPAYSSWNCDGEILTHTAIDVRYDDPSSERFAAFHPGLSSSKNSSSLCFQSALPVDKAVCTRDRRTHRVRGSHQPLCNINPAPLVPATLESPSCL